MPRPPGNRDRSLWESCLGKALGRGTPFSVSAIISTWVLPTTSPIETGGRFCPPP